MDVEKQAHYDVSGPQLTDFLVAGGVSFLNGCAIKYLYRAGKKDYMNNPAESKLTDLKKARFYLDRAILEAEKSVTIPITEEERAMAKHHDTWPTQEDWHVPEPEGVVVRGND